MLGGLALKRRWQKRRAAAGEPTDRPNLVMGINVQVCWRSSPTTGTWRCGSCRWRAIASTSPPRRPLHGATRTRSASWPSSVRPSTARTSRSRRSATRSTISRPDWVGRAGARRRRIRRLRGAVHRYRSRVGLPAAARDLDQRLRPQVRARLPWRRLGALARPGGLPTTSCSGSTTSATTCRPSRSTSRVRVRKSWRSTTTSCGSGSTGTPGSRRTREVATSLSAEIEELGPFRLITRGDELPVFAFTLNDDVDNYSVFDVSNALRERGWLVPAYPSRESDRPGRTPRGGQARFQSRRRRTAGGRCQAAAPAAPEATGTDARGHGDELQPLKTRSGRRAYATDVVADVGANGWISSCPGWMTPSSTPAPRSRLRRGRRAVPRRSTATRRRAPVAGRRRVELLQRAHVSAEERADGPRSSSGTPRCAPRQSSQPSSGSDP